MITCNNNRQESNIVFKGSVIRACNLAYMIVSTSMIMWLVLTVRVSTGGDLSTRQVFTLLSLLTSLRLSSYFFVLGLLGYSEGRVAIHRIQASCVFSCMYMGLEAGHAEGQGLYVHVQSNV